MAIIAIVAVDKNLAIGRGGSIPWRYPADLRFFKRQTTGHACVMGSRTWRSLGKPLKERLNIVLSAGRTLDHQASVIQFAEIGSVLSLYDYLKCDLYVIGGAQVYQSFSDVIDRWIVTEVPEIAEGADTFMNPGFLSGFLPENSEFLEDGLKVTIYKRDELVSPSDAGTFTE